jgi:hypothetical protein
MLRETGPGRWSLPAFLWGAELVLVMATLATPWVIMYMTARTIFWR